jgi:O-antigen ligase
MSKSRRSKKNSTKSSGNKQKKPSEKAAKGLTGFGDGEMHDKLRNACLATFVALIVITHLQPTEAWAREGGGAMTIMMWSLLLAAWALTGLLKPWKLRGGLEMLALVAFLGWIVISGYMMGSDGNLRATTNSVWIWIMLGIVYFLGRQLLVSSKEQRAVCGVMISLALVLSCHAYHQYFVSLPNTRAEYYENRENLLEQNGTGNPMEDAVARKRFEARLDSDEPLATFGLTNSLAGMLTPWLLLTIGLLISPINRNGGSLRDQKPLSQNPKESESSRVAMVLVLVAIAGCLILTKSRSAWLATISGLVVIAVLSRWRSTIQLKLRFAVIAAIVLAVALVFGLTIGNLDKEVFTQAGKSLGYRLEYWQATTAMISDHPLWGCGVGNFQEYYTQYKLPQSSEAIADPHNFAFEVASTAGIPALLAFVAFLALVARNALSPAAPESEPGSEETGSRKDELVAEEGQGHSLRAIFTGAFAGLIVAYPTGYISGSIPSMELIIIGLPLGSAAILLLSPWIQNGQLSKHLIAVAIVAMLINLSAAGGITFSSVALSFWLLVALLFNNNSQARDNPQEQPSSTNKYDKLLWGCAAACALTLVAFCNFTAYSPVIRANAKYGDGRVAWLDRDFAKALDSHRAATKIDPLWPTAKWGYASLLLEQWTHTQTPEALALFQDQVQQFRESHPQSSATNFAIGKWYLKVYRERQKANAQSGAIRAAAFQIPRAHYADGPPTFYIAIAAASESLADDQWLEFAELAFGRAAELHPNQARMHAQLAWVYWLRDKRSEAKKSAQRAYELDQKMPHEDQKLKAQPVYDAVAPTILPNPEAGNAEQLVDQIRKSISESAP